MARRQHDDALGVAGAETIIGSGVKAKGDIVSESDITIDGELTGSLTATGDVTVGVNGRIKANVRAGSVRISGRLTGNIRAEGTVSITETGQVEGDITSAGLAITPGGVFIGTNRMDAGPLDSAPTKST